MTDPVTVATIFQSVLNLGAAIANTNDAAKRQTQLIEFQKAITQAFTTIAELQLSNSALLADKNKLEQEIVHLKDWKAEREKYELKEIASGIFARVESGYVGQLQSAHKFCATCFEKNIKSPLQQQRAEMRQIALHCFTCKSHIDFGGYSDVS
jgi:hypothetical protein